MSRRLSLALATVASIVAVPNIAQAGGWGTGWGTGCGCGGGYSAYASVAVVPQVSYVPTVSYVPQVSYAAVSRPIYVVNQGPVYSGYGLGITPTYSTIAPQRSYPYYGGGPRYYGGPRHYGPRYSSYRGPRYFHGPRHFNGSRHFNGPRYHQHGKGLVPSHGAPPIDK